MNILILTPHFPSKKHGGGIRLVRVIKSLYEKHDIYLLSVVDSNVENNIESVKKYCKVLETVTWEELANCRYEKMSPKPGDNLLSKVIYLPRMILDRLVNLFDKKLPNNVIICKSAVLEKKLNKILEKYEIDVVQMAYPEMATFMEKIPNREKYLKVYDSIEIRSGTMKREAKYERDLFRKVYINSQVKRMEKYEKDICKNFDLVVAVSEKEKQLFKKWTKNPVIKISQSLDVDYFRLNEDMERENNSLVFVGNFKNYPNEDAMLYFTENIFSLIKRKKDARLYIVGDSPTEKIISLGKSDKDIIVTGYVDDIRDYLWRGKVFVAPIRQGGGVKGKIIEAMACGIPVVSSLEGSEGIEADPGKDFVMADITKPYQFSEQILKLLDKRDLWKNVKKNGRRLIEEKYNWENDFKKYMEIIEREKQNNYHANITQ